MSLVIGNKVIDWNIPSFLLVTGGSRGLGATIAVEFSKKLGNGSHVLLVARDEEKLKEVITKVENVSHNNVEYAALDLSAAQKATFEEILEKYVKHDFSQVILVNNAGTLGNLSLTVTNCPSEIEVKEYFDCNLFSAMYLTAVFLNVFRSAEKKLIINISSLGAIQPFTGWSLYCTAKSARDMYFRVLAEEEKQNVIVLNYAPGPLATDMLSQVLQQALPEIKQQFIDAEANNKILTTEFTVEKLIHLLETGNFKSGDHIDVFDISDA